MLPLCVEIAGREAWTDAEDWGGSVEDDEEADDGVEDG